MDELCLGSTRWYRMVFWSEIYWLPAVPTGLGVFVLGSALAPCLVGFGAVVVLFLRMRRSRVVVHANRLEYFSLLSHREVKFDDIRSLGISYVSWFYGAKCVFPHVNLHNGQRVKLLVLGAPYVKSVRPWVEQLAAHIRESNAAARPTPDD